MQSSFIEIKNYTTTLLKKIIFKYVCWKEKTVLRRTEIKPRVLKPAAENEGI